MFSNFGQEDGEIWGWDGVEPEFLPELPPGHYHLMIDRYPPYPPKIVVFYMVLKKLATYI